MYFNDLAKEFEIRNYKMFPMQENDINELVKTTLDINADFQYLSNKS